MATYIHGNTVRKEVVTTPAKKQAQSTQKQKQHVSAGYVMFLTVAAVVALFVCVRYLQLQSEVTNRSNNIVALQQELSQLQEENVAREDSIMNSINLEEIRKIAMKDLGMVYATADQIIYYEDPIGNKMTQFNKIPESGIVASADDME